VVLQAPKLIRAVIRCKDVHELDDLSDALGKLRGVNGITEATNVAMTCMIHSRLPTPDEIATCWDVITDLTCGTFASTSRHQQVRIMWCLVRFLQAGHFYWFL